MKRYIFQKYKSKDSRYTCPQCGSRHSLTLYIDTETGQPVHSNVGRCDHIQSCGYDYNPYQYFKDNPWERENKTSHVRQILQKRVTAPFIDESLVMDLFGSKNDFVRWLMVNYKREDIRRVGIEYKLGTFNNGVVFWQIDRHGNVRDGKIMYYSNTGHRQKYMNWISSKLKEEGKFPNEADTSKCFFGEHLIDCSEKQIVIVESEKSAIVCSILFPQFLWLATGGCGNLRGDKLKTIGDRSLIVIPDSGEFDKWNKILNGSGVRYTMVDFEGYPPNTDIVDIILGEVTPKLTLTQIINLLNEKKWKK